MGVYATCPCWLVFDQTWLDKYGFAGGLGGTEKAPPDWITRGRDAGGLAEQLGIPGDVLEATVDALQRERARRRTTRTSGAAESKHDRGGATRRCATGRRAPRSARSRRRRSTRSR